MVLNSQAPRPDMHSVYGSPVRLRKRRRNRRLLAIVVLALLVAVSLWAIFGGGSEKPPRDSDNPAVDESNNHITPPVLPRPDKTSETPKPLAANPQPPAPPDPKPPAAPPEKPKPAPAPAPPPAPTPAADSVTPATRRLLDSAADSGKPPVELRQALNYALATSKSRADADALRAAIAKLNESLVFSKTLAKDDPLATSYTIQEDDRLTALAPAYKVPWEFVARINNIDPSRLGVGRPVKFVRGPFHAVVKKSEFRLDLYLGDPSAPGSTYVRSFTVGLGTNDGTPLGRFIVKRGKVKNPPWTNPRTGEKFSADDPKNPIGERWLGLRGLDADSEKHTGYGIHGTIDPGSIGNQASMGCVRLDAADVELLYDMLCEELSTVTIDP